LLDEGGAVLGVGEEGELVVLREVLHAGGRGDEVVELQDGEVVAAAADVHAADREIGLGGTLRSGWEGTPFSGAFADQERDQRPLGHGDHRRNRGHRLVPSFF